MAGPLPPPDGGMPPGMPPDPWERPSRQWWEQAARAASRPPAVRATSPTSAPLRTRLRIGFLIATVTAVLFGSLGDAGVAHIGAYVSCKELVLAELTNPASAEFPPYHEAQFEETGGGWAIASTVRAMDAEGVPRDASWTCVVEEQGEGRWEGRARLGNA